MGDITMEDELYPEEPDAESDAELLDITTELKDAFRKVGKALQGEEPSSLSEWINNLP